MRSSARADVSKLLRDEKRLVCLDKRLRTRDQGLGWREEGGESPIMETRPNADAAAISDLIDCDVGILRDGRQVLVVV